MRSCGTVIVAVFFSCCGFIFAADDSDAFFEKKIRPLLVQHCFECHSEDAEESGLRLDSLAAILRGGERGPAIVAGKPDESLLISAVRHGELLKMPPKRKLSSAEVADLEQWVARGANWPGAQPLANPAPGNSRSPTSTFSDAQLQHWAFQRANPSRIPDVGDRSWAQSAIDAFILQTLASRSLSPASAADKARLIRRATLDLIGLPPTPEEVQEFLSDDSPDAWPRLVDRLLASPRYGERWGRHWLDVARYADSNGLDENLAYANAFRYRDYVVNSWNGDLPYDQFTREQLTGDLLGPSGDPQTDLDRIVATGFLTLGAKMLAEDDPVKMQMDIIDEQVDTVGRAFLGMTFGCARCHDHKFDPFTTAEYYALAGILASTKTMETHTVVARWLERPLGTPAAVAERDKQLAQIKSIDTRIRETADRENQQLLRAARLHSGDYLLAARFAERLQSSLKDRRPLGEEADVAKRPGIIIVEAEQYARGNVLKDTTSYGSGIGVLVNRGETPNFAEYDITVPEAGHYQLEVRYAAAHARPTKLIINGELVKADLAAGVTGGWLPENQAWKIEGFFELKSGDNVVRIEQPQFFPHIDKLLIAPAPGDLRTPQWMPLDATYKLLPEVLTQWNAFLRKLPENPLPVGVEWNEVLADGSSARIRELADRIQNDALVVVENWEKLLKDDGKATALTDARREALRQLLFDPAGPFAAAKELETHFAHEAANELKQLRQNKTDLEAALVKLPEAMAVADDSPRDLKIHIRGSHLSLGAVSQRRFPRVLGGDSTAVDAAHSGRRDLANWLTGAEVQSLTARVFVNRIWQWHFGSGLVRTSDNFGLLGDRPTHPELLDWLAMQFIQSGWSVKSLHRLILLSSAYQMSTQWNARAAESDPDNTLFWRFNRRRMEAETIRDSLLFVSGQLNFQMGGTQLTTRNREYVTSTASVDPVIYESRRRSIYLPIVRSALFDVFQAFDFADPSVSQGQRDTTTIAPQVLFLMNSKFVSERTRDLAKTLLEDPTRSDAERVQSLFQRAFGRAASNEEIDRAIQFVSAYAHKQLEHKSESADARLQAWQSLCRAILSTNEFVYVE